MVNRKTASALTIAALLACAVPVKSVSIKTLDLTSVIGQATPTWSVPDTVKADTKVRVSSGSDNMNAISQALGKGFEGQYAKTNVEVATKDANAAIQDVLTDNADLAAISRPLTEAEKAQGLVSVPVRREKIAIVVGKDNPFAQSLTGSQFAQIFRGEIKDWSSVGGAAGPIRVIDRPDTSETRAALQPYPVFTTAEFKTGDNTTQLSEDSTDALAKELGKDGIGYVLVNQLADQPNIKALELHKTPPSDPRYPFSQPYAFVYNGEASEAAAAFLGYATGNPGQAALEGANLSGGYSILPGGVVAGTAATATAGTANGSATSANGQAADANGTAGNGSDATAKDAANSEKTAANGANGTGANGQAADADGETAGANGIAGDGSATSEGADGSTSASGETVEGAADGSGDAAAGGTAVDASGNVIDGEAGSGVGNLAAGRGRWWWLLLPLAGLGLLIWAAGKRGSEEETGYIANTGNQDDETIRSNTFRSGDLPGGNVGASVDASGVGTGIGTGINKAAVGGTAIAGGIAAAGAGLAGRMKNKAGDITMDLDGIKGDVSGGIDNVKGAAQGGLGNLRTNVQGGIDGVKGGVAGSIDGVRGGIDGVRGNVAGGIDGVKGNVQGGIDGLKGQAEGGLSGLRSNVEGGIDNVKDGLNDGIGDVKKTVQGNDPDSWLDRAKQRINEATEQIKDSTSDIKDDITKE